MVSSKPTKNSIKAGFGHREDLKSIVCAFYSDIWNKFDLSPVEDLISRKVTFRGTLEETPQDREGFKKYVREIQRGFPDFWQEVQDIWVCVDGKTVVARMLWRAVC